MTDSLADSAVLSLDGVCAAVRKARLRGEPVLLTSTERIPWTHALDVLNHLQQLDEDVFYWEHPSDCLASVGIGAAHVVSGQGNDRFQQAKAEWRRIVDTALYEGLLPDGEIVGPVVFGGFSFDPARPQTELWAGFPTCRLVLPALMVTTTEQGTLATVNRMIGPDSDPEDEVEQARTLVLGALGGRSDYASDGGPSVRNDTARSSTSVDRARCESQPEESGYMPWLRGFEDGMAPTVEQHAPIQEEKAAAAWQDLVRDAIRHIHSGSLEKLVLARSVQVNGRTFNLHRLLARLRAAHPGCTLFAVAHQDRCFLGASPEQLVRLQGGQVDVSALAGTRRRGGDEREDVRLGQELLTDPKERSEHAMVVRSVAERLSDSCARLDIPAEPALLKLRQVQHLHTPIAGTLVTNECVLDLVARLHPTPAVGGVPQGEAMRILREREDLDRGWYASPVGWVGRKGDGEFVVALRSALLANRDVSGDFHHATLFAGCGIMADSDPESEYAESCSKLAAMLSVLDAPAP